MRTNPMSILTCRLPLRLHRQPFRWGKRCGLEVRRKQVLVVKLFDLCYSECAWDGLSKWFFGQFYFTKSITIMQKASA